MKSYHIVSGLYLAYFLVSEGNDVVWGRHAIAVYEGSWQQQFGRDAKI